jgi:hypothetical protein
MMDLSVLALSELCVGDRGYRGQLHIRNAYTLCIYKPLMGRNWNMLNRTYNTNQRPDQAVFPEKFGGPAGMRLLFKRILFFL